MKVTIEIEAGCHECAAYFARRAADALGDRQNEAFEECDIKQGGFQMRSDPEALPRC